MSFEIVVHRWPRVIEVVYPRNPGPVDIADYVARLRKTIHAQEGASWRGFVDQRQLEQLTPELLAALKDTNTYAADHGMIRLARLVPDALGTMAAWRVANEAKLKIPVEIFHERRRAWEWITLDLPA